MITQCLFLPSLVYSIPTRRNYSYKVMGQLRERVSTPPYTTHSQENKDYDEDHQGNGGRGWYSITKKQDMGRGTSPTLVEVT